MKMCIMVLMIRVLLRVLVAVMVMGIWSGSSSGSDIVVSKVFGSGGDSGTTHSSDDYNRTNNIYSSGYYNIGNGNSIG